MVQPIVLGKGKALFKDVKERHALTLLDVKPLQSRMVRLTTEDGQFDMRVPYALLVLVLAGRR